MTCTHCGKPIEERVLDGKSYGFVHVRAGLSEYVWCDEELKTKAEAGNGEARNVQCMQS